jgi:hypothetical protein
MLRGSRPRLTPPATDSASAPSGIIEDHEGAVPVVAGLALITLFVFQVADHGLSTLTTTATSPAANMRNGISPSVRWPSRTGASRQTASPDMALAQRTSSSSPGSRWHHLMSLLLHLANTASSYPPAGQTPLAERSRQLFCRPPAHVESVAGGREKGALHAFWVLTMMAYLRASGSPACRYPSRSARLGLLAKPMLVTLPWCCSCSIMAAWAHRAGGRPGFAKDGSRESPVSGAVRRLDRHDDPPRHRRGRGVRRTGLPVRVANALVSYVAYRPARGSEAFGLLPLPGRWRSVGKPRPQGSPRCRDRSLPVWRRRRIRSGWFCIWAPWSRSSACRSEAMADRYTYVPLSGLFVMPRGARDLMKTAPLSRSRWPSRRWSLWRLHPERSRRKPGGTASVSPVTPSR